MIDTATTFLISSIRCSLLSESDTVMLRPAVIGPLGPAQLTCIRSWRACGWTPLFVQLGERRAPAMLQRLLAGYLHVPESIEDETRITLVSAFLKKHDATGLTCLSYDLMGWLHRNSGAFSAKLSLWIATPQTLPILQSKRLQQQVACDVGLPVLQSFFVDKSFVNKIPANQFPVVLRPGQDSEVVPSFKMRLVQNQSEIRRFVDSRTRLGVPLIAQRFVNGPNLVVHGTRDKHGEHMNLAGFMATRKFDGVSLTIEPAFLPIHIKTTCQAFVDTIGYVGIYHFDFLFEPESGNYYFLEINGRLGGTTGKVFVSGYDEPRNIVAAYRDIKRRNYAEQAPGSKTVCTNKRGVLRALWETCKGNKTVFDYATGNMVRYPLELIAGLLTWRDEIFLPGHFKSGLAYTLHASMPAWYKRENH